MALVLFRAREELDWALPKVSNLAAGSLSFQWTYLVFIGQVLLVGVRLKQILRPLCFLSRLQMAEDQINPLGQDDCYSV